MHTPIFAVHFLLYLVDVVENSEDVISKRTQFAYCDANIFRPVAIEFYPL